MAAVVWKFALPVGVTLNYTQIITMPLGARVVAVDVQNSNPRIWAVCDPRAPRVDRRFYVRGTGHALGAAEDQEHLGTFLLYNGSFVGHVFGSRT